MKRIHYILLSCLLIINLSTVAQTPELKEEKSKKIEFGVNAFYGLSGLSGTLPSGTISPEMNAQFSFESSLYFTNTFGMGIGIGFADYSSKIKLNNYTSNSAMTDDGGDNMQYIIKANDISEKEKVSAFEIPLFVAYRLKLNKIYFESNVGIKASIPISAKYNYTGGSLTTTGYYEKYDIELNDMPEHGFQTFNDASFSGKLLTNTAFSAFAKVGIVMPSGRYGIHIGLYGSYGLNSILKSQSNLLVGYQNLNYPVTTLSNKISLISGGIKIGISL